MTLMSMMVFTQFPSTIWVPAMLSNDGNPVFRRRGEKPPGEKYDRATRTGASVCLGSKADIEHDA